MGLVRQSRYKKMYASCKNMAEVISTVAIVTALGSLLALVIEKMRMSRCTHIRCCCCELDRDVIGSEISSKEGQAAVGGG